MPHYSMSVRYTASDAKTVIHITSHGVRDGSYGDLWSRRLEIDGVQREAGDALRLAVLELLSLLGP